MLEINTAYELKIIFFVLTAGLFCALLTIFLRKLEKGTSNTHKNTHENRCSRKLGALK